MSSLIDALVNSRNAARSCFLSDLLASFIPFVDARTRLCCSRFRANALRAARLSCVRCRATRSSRLSLSVFNGRDGSMNPLRRPTALGGTMAATTSCSGACSASASSIGTSALAAPPPSPPSPAPSAYSSMPPVLTSEAIARPPVANCPKACAASASKLAALAVALCVWRCCCTMGSRMGKPLLLLTLVPAAILLIACKKR